MVRVLIFSCLIISLSSCIDFFEDPCFRELKFEIPVSLNSIKDTIATNSDIFLSSEVDYILSDLNSDDQLDTKEMPIQLLLVILKVNQDNHEYVQKSIEIIPSIGDFEIKTFQDVTIESEIGYGYNILYQDTLGKRKFNCKIKIQEPGLYFLAFDSFYLKYDPMLIPSCNENLRNNNIKLNDGNIDENNYHMILEATESFQVNSYNDTVVFANSGCYAFYVK